MQIIPALWMLRVNDVDNSGQNKSGPELFTYVSRPIYASLADERLIKELCPLRH